MESIKLKFKKLSKKDKIIFICGILLIGLLLISTTSDLRGNKASQSIKDEVNATQKYKESLEAQLKATLEKVEGVGEVEIMITFASEISDNIIYNENTTVSSSSSSSNSESSSKEVVMQRSNSESVPYSASDIYPEIVGVVVVARGAESPTVKANITEAVKVALGVASHKIVVLTGTK